MGRANLEVADIFCEYEEDYRHKYGALTNSQQWRTMHAIKICRTAALGGHKNRCDHCGHEVITYNSCRNRHCPKCQSMAKAEWLEARTGELLPVNYFHVVFTAPKLLNQIALQNQREVYNIFFEAVSKTLLTIAADPKHLGVNIGFMAIIHTWSQTLLLHPHIHCVIPGGGLSLDKRTWINCRKKFFLPVRVLSRFYRRFFIELLIKAFNHDRLKFHGKIRHLSDQELFILFIKKCLSTEWVVYAKPPFGGAEKVLDYLARYTHRIAISNNRLLKVADHKVSFTWRNYKKGNKVQTMTLEAEEFIRRFLLHVLPSGFMRIRYFGFLSNRNRTDKLNHCRKLLHVHQASYKSTRTDWKKRYESLTGKPVDLCPFCCKGHLIPIQIILPLWFPSTRPPPQIDENFINAF